jgi:hypothetical protein
MIAAVGNEKRQRGEPIENLRAIFGSGESLQKLLQNQPGGHDFLASCDGAHQFAPFACRGRGIPPEGQRPDAGLDKEVNDAIVSLIVEPFVPFELADQLQ